MAASTGFDWLGYFRALRDDEVRGLASWLAVEGLSVSEYMEVVDVAHVSAPHTWRELPQAFIALCGQPAAKSYARRKRHFARLFSVLEEALMTGALPGEVSPEELEPRVALRTQARGVDDLLSSLARARRELE